MEKTVVQDTPKVAKASGPKAVKKAVTKKPQTIAQKKTAAKKAVAIAKTKASTPKKPGPKPGSKVAKKPATKKAAPKKPAVKKVVEKKTKVLTKDEKKLYAKLDDAYTYVANLTIVIEERLMDKTQIPDLTLSELHVVEVVNKNNNKPMTQIANKLKITVGSLTTSVNRLIQKEYLMRARDEMDHRITLLSVTPKAKKVLKVHDKFHEDILYAVLDGVTVRDATKVMAQFANVLEQYINPKEGRKAKKNND